MKLARTECVSEQEMFREDLTSKYRKNEYMSRYRTMKGAKRALTMAIKMSRRRRLHEVGKYISALAKDERIWLQGHPTYPSTSICLFFSLRNTFLTPPLPAPPAPSPQRKPSRHHRIFHSRARVRTCLPRRKGSGTERSRTSLLNKAMR